MLNNDMYLPHLLHKTEFFVEKGKWSDIVVFFILNLKYKEIFLHNSNQQYTKKIHWASVTESKFAKGTYNTIYWERLFFKARTKIWFNFSIYCKIYIFKKVSLVVFSFS